MEGSMHVAIIDDDKIYHVITRKLIESTVKPKDIFEFYDGQEALDYLLQNQAAPDMLPDVIFLDIQMPYLDGWQFLDSYSQLGLSKNIDIYIVSSSISSLDHERFNQSNCVKEFIVKPFTRNKLTEIMQGYA